jgi:hypothetical protein
MLPGSIINALIKNYFYEVAFNILYTYGSISYQVSYRTSGNRIRNVGGFFENYSWDCEFVNGILFKINIKEEF